MKEGIIAGVIVFAIEIAAMITVHVKLKKRIREEGEE